MQTILRFLAFFLLVASCRADDGAFPFVEAGRSGYLKPSGEILLEPQFRSAQNFSQGLAAVEEAGANLIFAKEEKKKRGLWGYVNESGTLVIPFQFQFASPFLENGFAYVQRLNKKPAWISKTGELTETPQYSPSTPEDPQRLWVTEDEQGLFGYNNYQDDIVIPAKFQAAEDFSEDLAAVREDQLWGFIDRTGQYVIPPQFVSAFSFQDGLAPVQLANGFTIIGKDGKPKFEKIFSEIQSGGSGLFPAKEQQNDLWGYLDGQGSWKIPPQFNRADPFFRGTAQVCVKGFCGLINTQGEEILPRHFVSCGVQGATLLRGRYANVDYYFDNNGAPLYSPLRLRNFLLFALYTLPFVFLWSLGQLLVSGRMQKLKALEGEALRVLSFRTARQLARIRFLSVLLYIALFFFTPAPIFLGWFLGEFLGGAALRTIFLLGMPRPEASFSVFSILLEHVGGIILLIALMAFSSSGARRAWLRIEREVFHSTLTARKLFLSNARIRLITSVPIFLLVLGFLLFPQLAELGFGLSFSYLALLAILSPLLMRLSYPTVKNRESLLEELRTEMQERSGIKIASIGIIDEATGRISNAFATGLLPSYRRIYVTKNLLEKSSPEELKAILAHELGHFHRHDVARRVGLSLVIIWLLQFFLNLLEEMLPFPQENFGVTLLLWFLVGVPLFTVIIGWRSRKAEFAADRYAAQLTGDPKIVAQALEKIHQQSAIPSNFGRFYRFFLGHPSLEERRRALEDLSQSSL